jgi:hypothetical protein
MSTDYQNQSDPWRNEGPKFRAVAVVVLLIFSGFVFYDGKQSYTRYLKRCVDDSERPDCALWAGKPKPAPDQWAFLEQENGKWAIQLAPVNAEAANENLNRLMQAGIKPRLFIFPWGTKTTLKYLQIGRFVNKKDALAAGNQLKEKGFLQNFSVSTYKPASN